MFARCKRLLDKHVLIIGGGVQGRTISRLWRNQAPEIAEYRDVVAIQKTCGEKNVSVLFGDGKIRARVMNQVSLLHRIDNWYNDRPNYQEMDEIPCFKGSVHQDCVKRELKRIESVMKKDDELHIYITGHGAKYAGTLLWNDYLSRNLLCPKDLDIDVNKTLFISSCYSGQFLGLTNNKTVVITSASSDKPSQYDSEQGDLHFQSFTKSENGMVLENHARLCVEHENYYASDSLTYFVNKRLDKFAKARNMVEKIGSLLNGSKVKYFKEVAIFGFIIFDPTGLMRKYLDAKLLAIGGKMGLVVGKVLLAGFFPQVFDKINEWYTGTSFYRNSFTRKDRQILRWNHTTTLKKNDPELCLILTKLLAIKEEQDLTIPLTSYYYLYEKCQIFLKVASEKQVKEFVEIARNMGI